MFTPAEKRTLLRHPIMTAKSAITGFSEGIRLGIFLNNLPNLTYEDAQKATKTVRQTSYHWHATLPDGSQVLRCKRDCPVPTNNRKYYTYPNN